MSFHEDKQKERSRAGPPLTEGLDSPLRYNKWIQNESNIRVNYKLRHVNVSHLCLLCAIVSNI